MTRPGRYANIKKKKRVLEIWRLRKIVRILINIDLVLSILLLFVVLVAPPLTGLTLQPVLSGSMEPTIHIGALIAIAKTAPEQVQVGDIIGFHVQGMDTPVCHRVVEIVKDESGLAFRTRGDANENTDDWLVRPTDIIGKIYFNIAWLGVVAKFVKTLPGFILLMGVPAVIVIGTEIYGLLHPAPRGKKRHHRHQKSSPVPVVIAVVTGVSLLTVPWAMMAGNATSRTLGALAAANTEQAPYTVTRNMQNKGMVPLVICLTSNDKSVVFSESYFPLKPGESKEVEITGDNDMAVISTAGIFPLLPQQIIYGLFSWSPRFALLVVPAIWVVPLTIAGFLIFRMFSPGTRPSRRLNIFNSVLKYG
jgi:signal peptidase I